MNAVTLTETPRYNQWGTCCATPPGYEQFPPRCRKSPGHGGFHEALEDIQGRSLVRWANEAC